jgi:hypothetical protein
MTLGDTNGDTILFPPIADAGFGPYDYPITKFGAACDGVTDDHIPIQVAIDAAGANGGGTVVFPPQVCNIGTVGIHVGNGRNSRSSTYGSVLLEGRGGATSAFAKTMPPGKPRLKYSGSFNAVAINGPLSGWGVQNLRIDCTNLAGSTGLAVVSARYGTVSGLSVLSCSTGILLTTVAVAPPGDSGGEANAQNNSFSNFQVVIGILGQTNVNGSTGIKVTGVNPVADSFFNDFKNGVIELCADDAITVNGIYSGFSDSNRYQDILIAPCFSPNATKHAITIDWSINPLFPAGDIFQRVDTSPVQEGVVPYTFIGTPDPVTREWFTDITTANSNFSPPMRTGVYSTNGKGTWTPTLVGDSVPGSATYVSRVGNYTNSSYGVQAYFAIEVSNLGGASGNLTIGGLPIPMSSDGNQGACQFTFTQGWNSSTSGVARVAGYISGGQSQVTIIESGNGIVQFSPTSSWHTSPSDIKILGVCNYFRD